MANRQILGQFGNLLAAVQKGTTSGGIREPLGSWGSNQGTRPASRNKKTGTPLVEIATAPASHLQAATLQRRQQQRER
jgi:hypothetical protein